MANKIVATTAERLRYAISYRHTTAAQVSKETNISRGSLCGAKKYLHSELGRNLIIAQKKPPHRKWCRGFSLVEIRNGFGFLKDK